MPFTEIKTEGYYIPRWPVLLMPRGVWLSGRMISRMCVVIEPSCLLHAERHQIEPNSVLQMGALAIHIRTTRASASMTSI